MQYIEYITSRTEISFPGGVLQAIWGRAALQGMVFRPSAHKQGLKFKNFQRFFINRV